MTQEMMNRIIGKEVLIYSVSSEGTVRGVVEKIEDGWIEVKTKAGQQQYINIDYVSGILEQKVKNK